MALTDPKNTFAYHNSRMLTTHRDMSARPLKDVVSAMDAFRKADKKKDTCPESEALWFYGMNHGLKHIRDARAPLEPLEGFELDFVIAYQDKMSAKAVRAFYYLLWICTREARHSHSVAKDLPKMEAQFGPACAGFFASVVGGEDKIAKMLIANPPDCTVGAFVKCLAWQFYHSKWSSNYGGKAWGNVTDCLVAFVHGVASAEIMMDTIWTLSHNTTNIFNKGEFYKCHTHDLVRLLDVQRGEQIPEAVLTDPTLKKFAETSLQVWMTDLAHHFPGKVKEFVDWHKVEALGSVQKYPSDIAKQVAAHGMTPEAKAAIKAAEAAKLAAELQAKLDEEAYIKNHYEIMPGVMVEKVTINRAA